MAKVRTANAHTTYWDAYFRAEYHTWCALKGHTAAGNDPVDGGQKPSSPMWRGEGKAVHMAAAYYWLDVARRIRCK